MRNKLWTLFFATIFLMGGHVAYASAQTNSNAKSEVMIIPSNPDGYLGETTTVQVTSASVVG